MRSKVFGHPFVGIGGSAPDSAPVFVKDWKPLPPYTPRSHMPEVLIVLMAVAFVAGPPLLLWLACR